MAEHKNIAKGNAVVGIQMGGTSERWSTDGEGRKVRRAKGEDGVTEVTTFIERNPGHPRGPGISTWTHYEH